MNVSWRGAMTAIVTPWTDDDRFDRAAFARLIEWQIAEGIHGLVPCGTTGEGATMTDDEHRTVIETAVEAANGRVPILAGCGSNDTRRTVVAARRAADAGADGLLVVSPYYNKPNRSGMLGHYRAVAEATDLPIMLYNVPGRTGQDLGADGVLELAELPGIAAVKEASANLEQIGRILAERAAGLRVFSGDDVLALPTMALGAEGVVSVVSNEDPGGFARLADAVVAGNLDAARREHFRLEPLMRANFAESNPVPVKAALDRLGRCGGRVRAPLGPPVEATIERLDRALASAGLSPVRA